MNSILRKRTLAALVVAFLGAAAGGLLLRGTDKTSGDSKAEKSVPAATGTAELAVGEQGTAEPAVGEQGTAEPAVGEQGTADLAVGEQGPKAAAPARSADGPKAAHERQLLETVGALTIAHCYQTYLNIGFIADGKAKGAFTNSDANKVLDSVLSLRSSIDRNLAALAKMDLDKRDLESLEQMRDLSTLLGKQGKELKAFWDGGKEENAARYDDVRKDSWAAIGRLTGIGR
jgi:hypothetical protein